MKKCVLPILLLLCVSAFAQPLGTWRCYTEFSGGINVQIAGDEILCAGDLALFTLNKNTHTILTVQKNDGLSDAGIRSMAYHSAKNAQVIAYQSSNIDILIDNTVFNIPDIKNKVSGSAKNINSIATIGEFAYLATDLGIAVLDIDKKEIRNTYVVGNSGGNVRINNVTADNLFIYAATEEGLKYAPLHGTNLQDFNEWKLMGPPRACQLAGEVGNLVFAMIGDTLYRKSDSFLVAVRADKNWTSKQMTLSEGNLYVTQWFDSAGIFEGRVLKIDGSGSISELHLEGSLRPQQCVAEGNTLWVADQFKTLLRYENGGRMEQFRPNSPPSPGGFDMKSVNDVLYVAQGSTDPSYIELPYNFDGPVKYTNYQWDAYPIGAYGTIAKAYDLVDVDATASGDFVYYGSLQGGLVQWETATNTFTEFDETNSIVEACYTGNRKISALAVDKAGNLWMSNTCTIHSLKLKTPDNRWYQFAVPNDLNTVRRMIIDSRGWIWMTGRGGVVNVYDPGADITDPSDDRFVSLTSSTGSGALPSNNVFCVVEDKNNDIWVGTDQGIGTFFCAGSIFSQGGCDADKIKVERDGFIGYLFATEIVRAIAVDGANRKWVGTTNGLWLISADGKTELLKFTKDNSPLPVNGILSIEINQHTGQVFIGSENGMVSYLGDATLGDATKGTALVYPNPVRGDYSGPIAIKGLVDDAYVKIFDSGGTLVFQGKANGGQMVWDGKGYKGNRVTTGVYVVYAATDLGAEKAVAKIVFSY